MILCNYLNHNHLINRHTFYNRITENGAANDMKKRLSQVDGNTYKKVVKFNKTHPKYILPMQLALFAAGFDSPQIHKQAETVLNDIGYLAEGKLNPWLEYRSV